MAEWVTIKFRKIMDEADQFKKKIDKLTKASVVCAFIGFVLIFGPPFGLDLFEQIYNIPRSIGTIVYFPIVRLISQLGTIFPFLSLVLGVTAIIYSRSKGRRFNKWQIITSSLISVFLLFTVFLMGFPFRWARAKEPAIISFIAELRTEAEVINYKEGSYQNFNCEYNKEIRKLCGYIEKLTGAKPIIHQSQEEYCLYTNLIIKLEGQNRYYCIDSAGFANETITPPDQIGYCDGTTFVCPPGK